MMQPELYEQIEQYHLGKLNGEELRAFEHRLASEPDFAVEVEFQRQFFDALRMDAKAKAFRAQLVEVEKKIESGTLATVQNPKFGWRWLIIMVGILLMTLLGWWIWNKNTGQPHSTPQALFAANFSPPTSISTAAKRDANTTATEQQPGTYQQWNALWGNLETLYAQKDFEAALATLQQIQSLDPTGKYASETFFYAGLLDLQMNRPDLALLDFSKVTVGHTEEVAWYKALSLLALERTDEAKIVLEEIIKADYPQKHNAKSILNRL